MSLIKLTEFDTIELPETEGKNMKRIGMILMVIASLAACSTSSAYHKITAAKAKSMMSDETVVIVDVRTLDEYNEGHIKNAILIPNESIGTTQPSLLPNKDAVILVYCRSGNRSKQAADKLVSLGYTKIYDFGGIIDWSYGLVK